MALAVLPGPQAAKLHRFLRKLHWIFQTCQAWSDASIDTLLPQAAVVFCTERDWHFAVQAADCMDRPPLVVVLTEEPDNSKWLDVLKTGAFCLSSNPLRMTEMLPLLNHAWCTWRQNHVTLRSSI